MKNEEQLKLEIAHIFESGANEIRILEMIKLFIKQNYMTGTMKYDDGQNAGDIAKKFGVPVGELGCPHCGTVVHGAIHDEKCEWCDKPYFK